MSVEFAPTAFEAAARAVLEREGGYVWDPSDPGGETHHGISRRAYPNLDIKNLTVPAALEIYQRDYWEPIAGDRLPAPVALVVFDCAVNQGVVPAARFLQRCVGVETDGIIGERTLWAVRQMTAADLVGEYQAQRAMAYVALDSWRNFGLGWMRRLLAIHAAALKLAT